MKHRLTQKHIATQFKVSISTVSKALSNSKEISSDIRTSIQNYAKDHNYKPNLNALRLRTNTSKTIGIIVPNILNSFFSKVFAGVEEITTKRGYTLISSISNDSHSKEVELMQRLKEGVLDGVILSIAEETELSQDFTHLQEVANDNIPIVLFDRVTEEVACDKVVVDDEDAAFSATKKLIGTGCKTIALVSLIDATSVGKLRVKGYSKAIEEEGLKSIIIKISKEEDFNERMAQEFFYHKIDGILCLEENATLQTCQIVKVFGYKIPEDISIISFTNGKLQRYLTPSVTTVSQHGKLIGKKAAKMLIDRIESKAEGNFKTKVVKTTLIERESTK